MNFAEISHELVRLLTCVYRFKDLARI